FLFRGDLFEPLLPAAGGRKLAAIGASEDVLTNGRKREKSHGAQFLILVTEEPDEGPEHRRGLLFTRGLGLDCLGGRIGGGAAGGRGEGVVCRPLGPGFLGGGGAPRS